MNEPTVQHLERLSGAAARLATAGWLEAEAKGLGSGVLSLHAGLRAVLAVDGPGTSALPIGVIAWDVADDVVVVVVAHVLEEHRGSGVLRAMHDELVARAVNAGAAGLRACASPKGPGVEIAKKLGYSQEAVVLRLDV